MKDYTRKLLGSITLAASIILSGCSGNPGLIDGAPSGNVNVSHIPNAVPRYLPKSKYGNPSSYQIYGKTYYVLPTAKNYDVRGIASWYGTKFHGQLTASREPYNMYAMTAASPVLPIPCFVRVTNLTNGREVIVKVNDRGPFAPNRILDLSYVAAKKLGYADKGTAMVEVTAINIHNPNQTPPAMLVQHPQLYLQVGVFSYYTNASELKQRLGRVTNKHIRILESDQNHRALYHVQVGPLIDSGESDRLQQLFARKGFGEAITIIG